MITATLPFIRLADTFGMHDGSAGNGWIAMMLGMIVFWGLVIFGIVWLLRGSIGHGHHGASGDAMAILDRRLADGQISVEEYEQRRKVLGSPPGSAERPSG